MNKRFILVSGIIAVAMSVVIYLIEYFIFSDGGRISETVFDNLAFLPINAFIVVVIIERLLAHQEKQSMLQKLNMVVGAFYSEVGNKMLSSLKNNFSARDNKYEDLEINGLWKEAEYKKATECVENICKTKTNCGVELNNLKTLLVSKRQFLLGLLENPNLLEHESFTDLLWAVFHLTEELEARPSLDNLPPSDLAHINNDIQRIYSLLVKQWLAYAKHLQSSYPFLFSLLVRTHPFQDNPSARVNEY
jgi:hypothetical protein